MAKKNEDLKTVRTEGKTVRSDAQTDLFKLWAEGYTTVSKMWEQSYADLYDPWVESTGRLFDKAVELSKSSAPEKYKEFYEELINVEKNTLSKLYAAPKMATDKESLEKLSKTAEESSKLMKSWSEELAENTKRTQEMLMTGATPDNYNEFYNMWMNSYEKIIDQFVELFTSGGINEAFTRYTGVPSAVLTNLAELSKLWRQSYRNFVSPLMESTSKLMGKYGELTKPGARPEVYKEFYEQWMTTYREAYNRMFKQEFTRPSKEVIESMLESTNSAMTAYKSWLGALEKMQAKMADVLTKSNDPEAYKEFYELWLKTFEKAFDDFFDFMPTFGPLKEVMEPVKKAGRMQADTYISMSKAWMESLAKAQGKV
jgi:hypothetical protein